MTPEQRELLREARAYGAIKPGRSAAQIGSIQSAEPVSLLARIGASFARTPEGKQKILDKRGETGVLRNAPGFSIEDVADYVGDVPEMVGGFAGTLGGAGWASIPLGGLGAAAGDMSRQAVGMGLGSEEDPDAMSTLGAMAWGAGGEGVSRILGTLGKLVLRPHAGKITQRTADLINSGTKLDAELGTNLVDTMPASARTESPLLRDLESRVAGSPERGDAWRANVREPFREQRNQAFDTLSDRVTGGRKVDRTDLSSAVVEAMEATNAQRREAIGQVFDDARNALPEGMMNESQVRASNSLQALRDVAGKSGAGSLEGMNLAEPLRNRLAAFERDFQGLSTLQQMDDYRKLLGEILDSQGSREELANVGLDRHMRRLYGALKEDFREGIADGFAQRGLNPESPMMNVPASIRELLETGSQEALDKRDAAEAMFQQWLDLDTPSLMRVLRDPTNLESISSMLTGRNKSVGRIRQFKAKLGAEAPGELPASEEGMEVWRAVQADVFAQIKDAALSSNTDIINAPHLSGKKLQDQIARLGGPDNRILREILGDGAVDTLEELATFMRQSDVSERTFKPMTEEAEPPASSGMFDVVKNAFRSIEDRLFSGRLMNDSGRRAMTGQDPYNPAIRFAAQAMRGGLQAGPTMLNAPPNTTER